MRKTQLGDKDGHGEADPCQQGNPGDLREAGIFRQLRDTQFQHQPAGSGDTNEFAQHQTSRSTLFIEIEKGFEESLFYELKDTSRREVFLNPDKKAIDFYIAESKQPVIIKKLLTRAPLSKRIEKNDT